MIDIEAKKEEWRQKLARKKLPTQGRAGLDKLLQLKRQRAK